MVRLQFLKEEIVGRYKGIVEREDRERQGFVRRMEGEREGISTKGEFVV